MVKEVSEILEIAIKREEDAYTFYMEMHGSASEPGVKESLEFMAKEEKKHKEFLERYRDGGLKAEALRSSDVVDYKVAEYLEEAELDSNSKPEDVFLVAAHREQRAHQFYKAFAAAHPDGELRQLLLKMADEELRHKEKVEYLYSNTAFPQTSGG